GPTRQAAGHDRGIDVEVAADAPVTVWVVPHRVGPPSRPGDRITISDGHHSTQVEVWIEPSGGRWTGERPDGTPLDLEIVAVHAALMRGRNGAEVVMYSPPRKRDEDGNFVPNDEDAGDRDWVWDAEEMHGPESRALDLTTWCTRDVNPWYAPHVHSNIFCSGAAHLPDGRLLVAGGHIHKHYQSTCDDPGEEHTDNGGRLHCYDPGNAETPWTTLPLEMREARWYPTVTPLPDGRLLITGGSGEGLWFSDAQYFESIRNNYVVWDGEQLSTTQTLVESPEALDPPLATYPGVFLLPDDEGDPVVVVVETNRAWLYRYHSTGKALRQAGGPRCMTSPGSRSYPWYGAMVLLPLEPGQTTRSILAVGGAHEQSTDYTALVGDQCYPADPAAAAAQDTASTAQLLELDMAEPLADTGRW
ncbi:hypothetical protein AB0G02_41015, partial [Actinosynnema sp. NPDC023658]|uniref:hypothetical protein n=1 Tax=Actinosynnema sp. NPDC023658 TaxID=3155465 RepID=UPI0033C5880D